MENPSYFHMRMSDLVPSAQERLRETYSAHGWPVPEADENFASIEVYDNEEQPSEAVPLK